MSQIVLGQFRKMTKIASGQFGGIYFWAFICGVNNKYPWLHFAIPCAIWGKLQSLPFPRYLGLSSGMATCAILRDMPLGMSKIQLSFASLNFSHPSWGMLQIPRAKMSSGEIWYKRVFVRYPTRCVKNSTRCSRVEFLTYRVGYRTKLHELPFPRISPNTTRRSRVVFGLIRGNGNKCNFAQMSCRMANCSQVVFVINTTNEMAHFDYFTVTLGSI